MANPNRYYSSTAVRTQLTADVSSTGTLLQVASTSGFPSSTPFTLLLDGGTASEEIITVTGLAGTSLTVTRGEDGTSGAAHSIGCAVQHSATARDFREPQQHIAATIAHGTTTALVGVDDTQTLKNKTLDSTTQVIKDGAPVALADALGSGGPKFYSTTLTGVSILGPNLGTGLVVLSIPDPGFDYVALVSAYVQTGSTGSTFAVNVFLDGTRVGGAAPADGADTFSLTPQGGSTFAYRTGTRLGTGVYRGAMNVRMALDTSDTYPNANTSASALIFPAS